MHVDRLAFIAFPIADLGRSRAFYGQVLGISTISESPVWIQFDFGGVSLRAYLQNGAYRRQHSGLLLNVPDIELPYRELQSSGVDLRNNIRKEQWGGRVVTVADPDGNLFDLIDSAYTEAWH